MSAISSQHTDIHYVSCAKNYDNTYSVYVQHVHGIPGMLFQDFCIGVKSSDVNFMEAQPLSNREEFKKKLISTPEDSSKGKKFAGLEKAEERAKIEAEALGIPYISPEKAVISSIPFCNSFAILKIFERSVSIVKITDDPTGSEKEGREAAHKNGFPFIKAEVSGCQLAISDTQQ